MKKAMLIVLAMIIGTTIILTAMPSKAEALVKADLYQVACNQVQDS